MTSHVTSLLRSACIFFVMNERKSKRKKGSKGISSWDLDDIIKQENGKEWPGKGILEMTVTVKYGFHLKRVWVIQVMKASTEKWRMSAGIRTYTNRPNSGVSFLVAILSRAESLSQTLYSLGWSHSQCWLYNRFPKPCLKLVTKEKSSNEVQDWVSAKSHDLGSRATVQDWPVRWGGSKKLPSGLFQECSTRGTLQFSLHFYFL